MHTFGLGNAVLVHGRTSHIRVSLVSLHRLLLLDSRAETPMPQDVEQGDQGLLWARHLPGPDMSMGPSGSVVEAVSRRLEMRANENRSNENRNHSHHIEMTSFLSL